mmetsp:Transcript_39466/g.35219  ORF Transcript_39466/g.35219 Transcript_39466/m.35219 type:complete len:179 (+) Transcript_39466:40-576(+)|eukprot:CAMPEP_0114584820 /NCGR_PEP_ID=MMETSP0125-20121206/8452_1 /TAXON_ID=485358 ORGANISM="Aristerostoma sp., Strain ATCC 50986" /NCGR_SAMPLE_ID=MMETSP0125 /ASSEMBLY_ACC=CAM_ASM_000245 /LENGTH=178 /DNA_ID=CAMNT_0001779457 /DNA_START=157 /DNA_END=693 /DNA_ORIENTATION=+
MISIPKPIKHGLPIQNESSCYPSHKSEDFIKNLLDMSKSDMPGISKYLNLNLSEKFPTVQKLIGGSDDQEEDRPKLKTSAMMASLLKTPFASPFLNPSLFSAINATRNSEFSGKILGNYSDPEFYTNRYGSPTQYVGKLTKEERDEKVSKYLEKKHNRKWKHIRYGVRKDLADKRERV